MVRPTGSRSHTHTGWWFAGAMLLALAVLLAWTACQNETLRGRVAVLEQENRSLVQALAVRAAAASHPATRSSVPPAPPGPLAPVPSLAAADPLAAHGGPPGTPPRQGPLEEALQRLREPVPSPGASPFARP